MSSYQGPFVDVDVHQDLASSAEILDYLPSRWHDYFRGDGRSNFIMMPPIPDGVIIQHDNKRTDARPEGGGAYSAGTDYETMRRQLLDSEPDYRAILTHQLGEFGGHFNQYFSRALASAMNDWTIDAWLAEDERLFAGIVIPLSEPEEAAKEIRRVASHEQMVGVLLSGNTLGRPIGDPLYHPIYAAAEECDLPIICHVSAVGRPNQSAVAAGGRLNFMGFVVGMSQQAQHYISSLIVHGVFERFPSVKVLFNEFGIGWLPYAVTNLDSAYTMLKAESPWVKRLPSEYLLEHVRLSTQPLEETFEDKEALATLLDTVEGVEDMLCFSSDYPHGTMDDPRYTARRVPEPWRQKVLHENACKLFGLPIHVGAAVPS
jgi:predicted TIM-barrel fold metal-dependent hydrolase